MDGIFFHPAGYKHHFRDIAPKNGVADLKDDSGKIIIAGAPISTSPQLGHVCLPGYKPEKAQKPAK